MFIKTIIRLAPLILLTGLVILYTNPYLKPGFFPTHDGEWAIVRLAEMQREIKDLQIPPRFADYLNHGYGYPLFLFTYPLPYYLGIILKFSGFGLTTSIKILFILSVLLSAYFMYFLGRELVNSRAGFISAIFYTTSSYRLVNLYVRGSLGESLSLALFPLIFLFAIKYLKYNSQLHLTYLSISLFLLVLTHNVMSLIFYPLIIFFLFYYELLIKKSFNRKSFTRCVLPLFISLGLSAYFFLPAILERKYLILSTKKLADINQYFINLRDLMNSVWSYGIKPSFQIGISHLLAILITVLVLIYNKKIERRYFFIIIFSIIAIIILTFFSLEVSRTFWQLPPLSWLDFPWRFLTPLIFFISLIIVFCGLNKLAFITCFLLSIISIYANFQFIKPQYYFDRSDSYYATNDATTTSMDELMPVWVRVKPKNRYISKVESENKNINLSELKYNSNSISFTVNAKSAGNVYINTIYFPGWSIWIDGIKVPIRYNNDLGIINFDLQEGFHQVLGKFEDTTIRKIANFISLGSVFYILYILLPNIKNRKTIENE